jgi:hypothetical protein
MRLRIVRPLPTELEGTPLGHLRFGAAYDLRPPLYDLLLITGYGVPEGNDDGEPAEAERDRREGNYPERASDSGARLKPPERDHERRRATPETPPTEQGA